jgi:2-oxoisovalerate dehydrogenase E1 component alpha subunit
MYRTMLLARVCDEVEFRLNRQGKVPFAVPSSGHEATQVGTAWALKRGVDVFVPYYRDRAVALCAGFTPFDFFLAVFAKASDPSSGGRQMPSHWSSRRLGVVTGSSVIATQVPHAVGIAYAMKLRGEPAVSATWFGEGASSKGDVHESMNFAGIHRLPVVFVCENNGYAISVPSSKQVAVERVSVRAAGYGFPGVTVDGNDLLACYGAMREAVDRARGGGGPTLVESTTYRFMPHTSDDDDRRYRSREEVEEARRRDPLLGFAMYLAEQGLLDEAASSRMRAEAEAEVQEAVRRAEAAPGPEPATLYRHLFAEETP